jgi:hypothetical protein
MEDWQNWTPCEMYGHDFDEDGWCSDCDTRQDNDTRQEDDENS